MSFASNFRLSIDPPGADADDPLRQLRSGAARVPSPTWGGVGVGGRAWRNACKLCSTISTPPRRFAAPPPSPQGEGQRVRAAVVMVVAVLGLWPATQALADDYAGCVAAYQRYNANIDALNAQEPGNRTTYCQAIQPEVGFAACETFIKSGFGTPAQRTWASQVSDSLAGVYAKCEAQ